MYARFADFIGRFDVGHDIRPVAPTTRYDPWTNRIHAPAPSAPISPNKFWDNVTILYSAYFPSNDGSLRHDPTTTLAQEWDQPIQNPEYTPEPV